MQQLHPATQGDDEARLVEELRDYFQVNVSLYGFLCVYIHKQLFRTGD